jgi:predicted CXXCH cytochrome family protein
MARAWVGAAWLLLAAQSGMAGTIAGSAHDFSTAAWGGGQVCVACHAPHNAMGSVSAAPIWNHTVTTQIYSLYASSTLKATMGQPTGSDKLCLSCHDGTVAVDSFRAATGMTYISSANNLGTNLNVHHPSSFLYDAALATANGSLFNPGSKVVMVGAGAQSKTGTISAVMLSSGQLQCSSCHDVHNTYTASTTGLLKISMARSAMCFACHDY